MGGGHQLLLVYDASQLSTMYVVKSPVLGLQRAPENSELAPSVSVLSDLCHKNRVGNIQKNHGKKNKTKKTFSVKCCAVKDKYHRRS